MKMQAIIKRQLSIRRQFGVQLVAIVVAAHGIFILATTLLIEIAARRGSHLNNFTIDLPLIIGLTLLYVSVLLRRRKRTAWLISVIAYTFYLGINIANLLANVGMHQIRGLEIVRAAVLPVAILLLLIALQKEFVVRSDSQGFRVALRFSLLILLVTFVYGVAGFLLLDQSDFHQEISTTSAIHYTVDQFDLTTNHPLKAHTKRAHLFVDSLSFVSIGALAYVVISLFQPLRARFTDQTAHREQLELLLNSSQAPSEDYFKIWPHDKQYFFSISGQSGLAFHVYHGVALCVGDPAGKVADFKNLLSEFQVFCYNNDWTPALIHVENKYRNLYAKHNYSLQMIGQEAIVDIAAFESDVSTNKYFRQIRNKFTKQGFTAELLTPPHHKAVLDRLRVISDEWLKQPGRTERGFVMGYFSDEYLERGDIMVVRDAAGTIQAFLNQVPATFDIIEGTFDMLRHTNKSLGNINDYLLLNFISHLHAHGFSRLNLGLCPLVGLDDISDEQKTLIDNVLRFAYANGDRFYSFSGLYRFKNKYEPRWRDRYIAYQGGVRGFSRTMNALMRVMRVRTKSTT